MQQEERDFRYPVRGGDLCALVREGGGRGHGRGAGPRKRGRVEGELVLRRRGIVRVSITLQRC